VFTCFEFWRFISTAGKDPTYVCEDFDPKTAAGSLADGAMYNTGQSCTILLSFYLVIINPTNSFFSSQAALLKESMFTSQSILSLSITLLLKSKVLCEAFAFEETSIAYEESNRIQDW